MLFLLLFLLLDLGRMLSMIDGVLSPVSKLYDVVKEVVVFVIDLGNEEEGKRRVSLSSLPRFQGATKER